ncbi:unnamed protein product [Darwinula stevensoni]|uniref:G domain-containing protein n=1 Tax=Darwinula stevensoni TaxID=69355 RepID=A0A7R9AF23_9CRUS|nr:unnamed protein product [Darwinula stevensoni]CAG0901961.1 unnamed protein product [Darwinula stevensoni]
MSQSSSRQMEGKRQTGRRTLAQRMMKKCECIDGDTSIRKLPRKEVMKDPQNRLAKYEIGGSKPASGSGKVLMLVGATGAGKSTLINGIVNYVYGVRWEDNFRFKLIVDEGVEPQSQSQTKWITAYTLPYRKGFILPHTLTVIDTPGFGDTEGIQADENLTNQIREFFNKGGSIGVDQLDGICFVVQASLPRLTHTQKYIFSSILALFGKDVETIVNLLITFCDNKTPPVLAAIKDAHIPHTSSFTFNNSAFSVSSSDKPDSTHLGMAFWKMGTKSFRKFFKSFQKNDPVSLTLTKEVLEQRKHLETLLQGILPQLKTALGMLEQLRETHAALRQHKTEMDANRDFTFTVKVSKHRKVELHPGTHVTNCLKCCFTCHYPCYIPKDKDKARCAAMHHDDGVQRCAVCPMKCLPIPLHVNNQFRFEFYEEEETHTYFEVKRKYEAATERHLKYQGLLKALCKDFIEERMKLLELTRKAHECLQELERIALKPNPLSIQEYIDILIETEKREAKLGYTQRIKYLADAKEKGQLAEKLKGNFNPFEEYMKDFGEKGMDISLFDPDPVKDEALAAGAEYCTN